MAKSPKKQQEQQKRKKSNIKINKDLSKINEQDEYLLSVDTDDVNSKRIKDHLSKTIKPSTSNALFSKGNQQYWQRKASKPPPHHHLVENVANSAKKQKAKTSLVQIDPVPSLLHLQKSPAHDHPFITTSKNILPANIEEINRSENYLTATSSINCIPGNKQHEVFPKSLNGSPINDEKIDRRRKRIPWTAKEEHQLEEGVEKYGVGNWAKILTEYHFHSSRTSVDLKDKHRNIQKQKERPPSASLKIIDICKMVGQHRPFYRYTYAPSNWQAGRPNIDEWKSLLIEYADSLRIKSKIITDEIDYWTDTHPFSSIDSLNEEFHEAIEEKDDEYIEDKINKKYVEESEDELIKPKKTSNQKKTKKNQIADISTTKLQQQKIAEKSISYAKKTASSNPSQQLKVPSPPLILSKDENKVILSPHKHFTQAFTQLDSLVIQFPVEEQNSDIQHLVETREASIRQAKNKEEIERKIRSFREQKGF